MADIDTSDLLTGMENLIPYIEQRGAISVGFSSVNGLIPLLEALGALLDRKNTKSVTKIIEELGKQNKNANDIAKQTIENDNKRDAKEATRREKEERRRQQQTAKNNADVISKALGKFDSVSDSKFKKFIVLATKAWDGAVNEMKGTLKNANIYADLEHSGVLVRDGFDSLVQSASTLGMTHEDLAKRLQKMAPTIAKLNNTYGNGVKAYEKATAGLTQKYQMSQDDAQAAFETYVDSVSPIKLLTMSEEELTREVDKQAKSMKALSLATGKTVSQLKEEQDAKDKALRVKVWKEANPEMYKALYAAGRGSDDYLDYFASGGTRINSKILMNQAGSEFGSKLDRAIMEQMRDGTLTQESVTALAKQLAPAYERDSKKAQRDLSNHGIFSAAAGAETSELYFSHGSYANRQAYLLGQAKAKEEEQTPEEDENRKKDTEFLTSLQNMFEKQNITMNNIFEALGGYNRIRTEVNLASKAMDEVAEATGKAAEAMRSLAPETRGVVGAVISTAGNILATTLGMVIGDVLVKKFFGESVTGTGLFSKAFSGLKNVVKLGFTGLGKGLSGLKNIVKLGFTGLGKGLSGLTTIGKWMVSAFKWLGTNAIGKIITSIGLLPGALGSILKLGGYGAGLAGLYFAAEDVGAAVADAVVDTSVKSVARAAGKGLATAVGGVVAATGHPILGATIANAGNALVDKWTTKEPKIGLKAVTPTVKPLVQPEAIVNPDTFGDDTPSSNGDSIATELFKNNGNNYDWSVAGDVDYLASINQGVQKLTSLTSNLIDYFKLLPSLNNGVSLNGIRTNQ
jgi:hypothetical protein